ncbi:MAG: Asp-tRNA(Asn)/Glu-tRNA(Gln) amidotransferase subunit GatB [Candidatus Gracilibacteria bacterium]|nr:Asp-tRNA(Asn)/Glu-tRNA(Gln) amidotransferase subunit GatB [Candidatus Gracilibacteria bacterium]
MKYEPVIGIEIHVQLATKTKMFCSCDNDSFGKEANINTCPICMGYPGMLPVTNAEALEKGVLAALALNCKIESFSKFDRKHYFYPDLPKGFQISQYDQPLATGGFVETETKDGKKKIRIHRLHLEDDAGKLIHTKGGTLCDYNRSGTPLAEIVSEADMHSPEEARAYAEEVHRRIRACGASTCDMEKGMMRFDINISLRPVGQEKFGTKAEVKNLNSFRFMEMALKYEIKRQTELLEKGEKVVQETRGFDLEKGITYSQRSKEEAKDYRYFPEPDLPPMTFTEAEISKIATGLSELPHEKEARYQQKFALNQADANQLASDAQMSAYFEEVVAKGADPKEAANWITSSILAYLNEHKVSFAELKVSPEALAQMTKMIKNGIISKKIAKDVLEEMYKSGKMPEEVVEEKGLKQVSDESEVEKWCQEAIVANEKIVADYKGGNERAIGALVGHVMNSSKGQANPGLVNKILQKLLQN